MTQQPTFLPASAAPDYDTVLADVAALLETARRAAARSVNSVMTATYWQIARRLVEVEQGGQARADYGTQLLKRLSADLTQRFGRGFSERNLEQMRLFTKNGRFRRHCLRNPRHRLGFPPTPNPFRFPGSTMSSCFPFAPRKPDAFMRPKPCAASGFCASSIGRSAASFTSEPLYYH